MNSKLMFKRPLRLASVSAVLGLVLAACGGGGGGDGGGGGGTGSGSSSFIGGGTVSARAGESSANFVAAVREIIALGPDEASESLSLQGVNAPPEDNTSEPAAAQ